MKQIIFLIILIFSYNALSAESKFIITLDKKIYQNYELEKKSTIQSNNFLPECGLSHEGKFNLIEEIDSYCIVGEMKDLITIEDRIEWKCVKQDKEKQCYAILVGIEE